MEHPHQIITHTERGTGEQQFYVIHVQGGDSHFGKSFAWGLWPGEVHGGHGLRVKDP